LDWRFDGLTALVSIAAGKAADLVVLAGNRAKNIDDVERVETVFKDGAGYDPKKLMRSVEGRMGCVDGMRRSACRRIRVVRAVALQSNRGGAAA